MRLVEAEYPIQGASDHHVSEALYLADPDGNGLEIYADRSRDRWLFPNGSMTSRPWRWTWTTCWRSRNVRRRLDGNARRDDAGHIHLNVADLARATEFYRDVLGLDSVMYIPEARMSFLSAGGYHHHIGLNTWAGEGAPRAPEEPPGCSNTPGPFPTPTPGAPRSNAPASVAAWPPNRQRMVAHLGGAARSGQQSGAGVGRDGAAE